MIAATRPVQRPADARLLVVDAHGAVSHRPRASLADVLRAGDLLVANDAATLPASLFGIHDRTASRIEVRLAGHVGENAFRVVIFGDGDFRTRTEDRPPPPSITAGDRLTIGPLRATVLELLGHPRLAQLTFEGTLAEVWSGIARHGRPIQYPHLPHPLALWDVWTSVAAHPAAFEPPSAGFVLSWALLDRLREHGVGVATLTHAAGISSTGDPGLDARLPFDEPYFIPARTSALIDSTRRERGRIVALGTTVVRALEDAANTGGHVRPGPGVATKRIGPATRLTIVDAILTGTHEPGTSHHELLRAFADDGVLGRVDRELDACGYRTHEFGDSIFLERRTRRAITSEFPGDPRTDHHQRGAGPDASGNRGIL